jgi:hypothetical protein
MSFNFRNDKVHDVRRNYEQLGIEFCKCYYKMFDDDFPSLGKLYIDGPRITFRDDKFGSFDELKWRVYDNKIWSFTHHEINGNVQPIDNDSVLISTYGVISANGSITRHKFNETLLLCRNRSNGRFYIHNSIFNLVD